MFNPLARWCLLAFVLATSSAIAFEAQPRKPVDLQGRWVINYEQSEDPEKLLMERLEKQRAADRKRLERYLRRSEPGMGQRSLPPIGEEGVEVPAATRAARDRVLRRRAREEDLFKQMLNVTKTLEIRQEERRIDINSAIESRRFDAGSESQISMPEGQLADLEVGWDGTVFVVSRTSRNGPRAIERFRLLKTGQLEYTMAWSGETELAGMKVRRVFERATAEPPMRDPNAGPVR
jgi:hypothetical protein